MNQKQLIDSAYIKVAQLHRKLKALEGRMLDLQMEVQRASQDADGLCSWLEEQRFKEPAGDDPLVNSLDQLARIIYHPELALAAAGGQ